MVHQHICAAIAQHFWGKVGFYFVFLKFLVWWRLNSSSKDNLDLWQLALWSTAGSLWAVNRCEQDTTLQITYHSCVGSLCSRIGFSRSIWGERNPTWEDCHTVLLCTECLFFSQQSGRRFGCLLTSMTLFIFFWSFLSHFLSTGQCLHTSSDCDC